MKYMIVIDGYYTSNEAYDRNRFIFISPNESYDRNRCIFISSTNHSIEIKGFNTPKKAKDRKKWFLHRQ